MNEPIHTIIFYHVYNYQTEFHRSHSQQSRDSNYRHNLVSFSRVTVAELVPLATKLQEVFAQLNFEFCSTVAIIIDPGLE